jgi:flagellin-like hook-associated protein FlgL
VAVCVGDESYYFGQRDEVEGTEVTKTKTEYTGTTGYATNKDSSLITNSKSAANVFKMTSAKGTVSLQGAENKTNGAQALNNALDQKFEYTILSSGVGAMAESSAVNTYLKNNGLATTSAIGDAMVNKVNQAIATWQADKAAQKLDAKYQNDLGGYIKDQLAGLIKEYGSIETGVYADANGNWTSAASLAELAEQAGMNMVDVDAARRLNEFVNNIAASADTLFNPVNNEKTKMDAAQAALAAAVKGKAEAAGRYTDAQAELANARLVGDATAIAIASANVAATSAMASAASAAAFKANSAFSAATEAYLSAYTCATTNVINIADNAKNALIAGLNVEIDAQLSAATGGSTKGEKFYASAFAANDISASIITAAKVTGKSSNYVEKEGGIVDYTKSKIEVAPNGQTVNKYTAEALASAINANEDSEFWAMIDANDNNMLYVFHKEGGNNNSITACEVGGHDDDSRAALEAFDFQNVESGDWSESGTSLSLGGEDWATLKPVQTKTDKGNEVWNVTLNGRDVGKERDLWIANPGEIRTPGLEDAIISGMDRDAFQEIQNADDAPWAGAEVRTQSAAQESLDAITDAITRKDKIRADLGAMQNRLENTMTNLEIQAENLQASESRISDVDVAKEMTTFTKNNVLSQAAVGMLSQANSMSQMALSLLG